MDCCRVLFMTFTSEWALLLYKNDIFQGYCVKAEISFKRFISLPVQQTRYSGPTLVYCWLTVNHDHQLEEVYVDEAHLTFFATFMANIEESHPGATELLEQGAISVARSFIPDCRNAVDKTIEETIMKHAMRTKHGSAMLLEVTFSMADMLNESDSGGKHKDNRPSEIQKSEKMVSTTMNPINNFINPFDVDDKSRLYCFSSGVPAPRAL